MSVPIILKEFQSKYPSAEFGEGSLVVHVQRDWEQVVKGRDWSKVMDGTALVVDKGWKIDLDHQCDNWVVGNVEHAETFLTNQMKAIKYCRTIAPN